MNILPEALLRPILSRTELLTLPKLEGLQLFRLAVHRNHSFELVASVLNVFLAQSRLEANLLYSNYDDSLSFVDELLSADAHMFWVDMTRYEKHVDLDSWLMERILALREKTSAPILICPLGMANAVSPVLPDVFFHNLSDALTVLSTAVLDERLAPLSGTRLSNVACLEAARLLGLCWLPSCFFPSLKALALDCDNTLYAGVLGEEGPKNVAPYLDVQRHLLKLKRQGILLTLVSKNEEEDVRDLFEQRRDFPLRWKDFAATAINWSSKSDNLCRLAQQMNIGTDSMLFVDDNFGELMQMAQVFPKMRLVAATSPEATLRGLQYCPLLSKGYVTVEDSIRSSDVRANVQRQQLHTSLSPEEYRRQLHIRLTLGINPLEKVQRVAELLSKTNQFVFTFLRPSEQIVYNFMLSDEAVCVTCSMSDVLSDSGLIAVVLARRMGWGTLRVEELAISCRALGRGIETGMLFLMLVRACTVLNCEAVTLTCIAGPRNAPARQWLQECWPGIRTSDTAFAQIHQLKCDLSGVEIMCSAYANEGDA